MNVFLVVTLLSAAPVVEHTTWWVKTPGWCGVTAYAPVTRIWRDGNGGNIYNGHAAYQAPHKYYYYRPVTGQLVDVDGTDVTIRTKDGTEIYKYGLFYQADQKIINQFKRERAKRESSK